jgi:poly-beta-1,6-N-acetyl-D-glucosamine synthase
MIRSYVVVTPARDEADNLPRLASCLLAQTARPQAWHIVDNGSTDGTLELARRLSAEHDWIHVVSIPGASSANRGAPVVRALKTGIEAVTGEPEILINVDADISVDPDYFERLLAEFDADDRLGIASGGLLELERGAWRQRHLTGTTVVGASRAYRWECLQQILPLEERVAWDGLDEFKANALGWRTRTFGELEILHHRKEGARDGTTWRARLNQGHAAHYVGYRFWYLVLRALWNARRDPAAVGMVCGYATAALRREPRNPDPGGRRYLRRQQSIWRLPKRALEASGLRRRAA